MSALIAVCRKETVWFLTDGMAIDLKDGTVGSIHPKQIFLRGGMVIANISWQVPNTRFARLVHERIERFDDLAEVMVPFWREVRATVAEQYRRVSIAVAGYSEKAGRVQMHVLREFDGNCQFWPHSIGYVAGPGNDAEYAKPFHARLHREPDAVDANVDGLAFMELTRRVSMKDTEAGPRHAVGGFIQCTRVAADRSVTPVRANIETEIIHHWPDRIGHPVNCDALADFNLRDENRRGLTLAELAKEREALVRALALAASAGPPPEEVALLRARGQALANVFDQDYGTGMAAEYFWPRWSGSHGYVDREAA